MRLKASASSASSCGVGHRRPRAPTARRPAASAAWRDCRRAAAPMPRGARHASGSANGQQQPAGHQHPAPAVARQRSVQRRQRRRQIQHAEQLDRRASTGTARYITRWSSAGVVADRRRAMPPASACSDLGARRADSPVPRGRSLAVEVDLAVGQQPARRECPLAWSIAPRRAGQTRSRSAGISGRAAASRKSAAALQIGRVARARYDVLELHQRHPADGQHGGQTTSSAYDGKRCHSRRRLGMATP